MRCSSAVSRASVAARRRTRLSPCTATPQPQRRVFCSSSRRGPEPSMADVGLTTGRSAAVGALAGTISALTGAGGGLVLIPALAKISTMTQQTINGTQHGAVVLGVLLGTYDHLKLGTCNLPLALLTTIPSILCARIGVQLAQRLSSKRLSLVVGAGMLACAPLMVLKNSPYMPKLDGNTHPLDLQLYRFNAKPSPSAEADSYWSRAARDVPGFLRANAHYALAGSLAGFIAGLCGTGGGILMTAYFTAATSMPQEVVIGTSLIAVVPMAGSSAYFSIKAKAIHLPTAFRVGVGLGAGVYLTSKYVTHQVPEGVLRGLLATTLGTSALVMMRRGL